MYDACSPQLGNRNGLVDISRPRLGGMTRGTMDIDGARNAKLEAFRKAFGYHEQATIAAVPTNLPSFVPTEAHYSASAVPEQRQRGARDDQLISVGIGRTRDRADADFELVVYCQKKSLRDHPIVEKITKLSKAEVRVIITGPFRRQSAAVPDRRSRPLRLGVSVGHTRVTAGTLGCFVQLQKPGGIGLLSNNHVLAASNEARFGDEIIQPGRVDGGRVATDVIGVLHEFVPITFGDGAINTVDCAVATLAPTVPFEAANFVDHERLGTRLVASPNLDPELRQKVTKFGRTSERTNGQIVSIEQDNLWVNYGSRGSTKLARFDGQLQIVATQEGKAFSAGGDSGSVIVDSDGRPTGLLFAGTSSGVTSANPIGAVLDALTCSIYV